MQSIDNYSPAQLTQAKKLAVGLFKTKDEYKQIEEIIKLFNIPRNLEK